MGLMLPGWLADLLNDLGYTWPESDEGKMLQLGRHWMEHGSNVAGVVQGAHAATGRAHGAARGASMDAFGAKWAHQRSAANVAQSGAVGADVIGMGLFACSGVVLGLKVNVIVQLTLLLVEIVEAVATSGVTFGASLLEIPVFKKLTDMAINLIINLAMEAVLG